METTDITLLHPLVDALGITFQFLEKSQYSTVTNIITGKVVKSIPILQDSTISIPLEVSFSGIDVETKEAWVVLKSREDLWVLLSYQRATDNLHCHFINAILIPSRDTFKVQGQGKDLKTILVNLNPHIVVTYVHGYKKTKEDWVKVYDNSVDGCSE